MKDLKNFKRRIEYCDMQIVKINGKRDYSVFNNNKTSNFTA